jgi:hypothetical protein
MSRGPVRFTQADVVRAIKAARKAGGGDVVVLPDGSICITSEPATVAPRVVMTEDEILDRELAEFEAEHG